MLFRSVAEDDTGVTKFTQHLWETLKPQPLGTFASASTEVPAPPPTPPTDDDIIPAEALNYASFFDLAKKPKKKR